MHASAKALWLGLLLAACTTAPPLPLLSPLDQAKRYGYTERELAPDRLEVSYVGPRHRVPFAASPLPEPVVQPVRAEALDLALWHAAEFALARGVKGVRVIERQSFVDTRPELLPDVGWSPWPTWRYPTGFMYGPPGYAGVPDLYIQARATVTVQLVPEPQGDDLDAAATITRLRAAHPDAEGPRAPAQSTATWPRDMAP
jgi:hypothetical protein